MGIQTDPVEGLEEINFKVMLHGEEEEPSEGTDPEAGEVALAAASAANM